MEEGPGGPSRGEVAEMVSAPVQVPLDTNAVQCRGLTKDYGQGHGLFDLDLAIGRGEVFGFVGPNGAGKTTTIRLLMDLIRPDRGTASILGLDSRHDSRRIKQRVGYLPGELPAFPGVSAGYVVGLLAGLRGGVDPTRIAALAERLDLDLGRRYQSLSHGNKQKVHLVQAFMHAPEVLILDEPTLGLDPLMQREFRAMVAEAAAAGSTVLLSLPRAGRGGAHLRPDRPDPRRPAAARGLDGSVADSSGAPGRGAGARTGRPARTLPRFVGCPTRPSTVGW